MTDPTDESWFDAVERAAEHLPLPKVPPVLSAELRGLFGEPELPTLHQAVVVFDSREERQLAGVRGSLVSEGWSLNYTCGAADVAFDVWPQSSTLDIDGHVMTQPDRGGAYRIRFVGPVSAVVETDALGRFRLEDLEPGEYAIRVGTTAFEISLSLDLATFQ